MSNNQDNIGIHSHTLKAFNQSSPQSLYSGLSKNLRSEVNRPDGALMISTLHNLLYLDFDYKDRDLTEVINRFKESSNNQSECLIFTLPSHVEFMYRHESKSKDQKSTFIREGILESILRTKFLDHLSSDSNLLPNLKYAVVVPRDMHPGALDSYNEDQMKKLSNSLPKPEDPGADEDTALTALASARDGLELCIVNSAGNYNLTFESKKNVKICYHAEITTTSFYSQGFVCVEKLNGSLSGQSDTWHLGLDETRFPFVETMRNVGYAGEQKVCVHVVNPDGSALNSDQSQKLIADKETWYWNETLPPGWGKGFEYCLDQPDPILQAAHSQQAKNKAILEHHLKD